MLLMSLESDLIVDEMTMLQQSPTRQARRENKREKAKVSKLYKKNSQTPARSATKSKKAKIATKQACKPKKISFEDHSCHVANMIVRIASDIECLASEEGKWFDGRSALIDALAREHNVVNKYRQAYAPTTKYEKRVISRALEICDLDDMLEIEITLGQLRLHAKQTIARQRDHEVYRQLRVA